MRISTNALGICGMCQQYFSIEDASFEEAVGGMQCPNPSCTAFITPASLGFEQVSAGTAYKKVRWVVPGKGAFCALWSNHEPMEAFWLFPWSVVPRNERLFDLNPKDNVIILDTQKAISHREKELLVAVCQKWAEVVEGELGVSETLDSGYTLHRNTRFAEEYQREQKVLGSNQHPDGPAFLCFVDAETFCTLKNCQTVFVLERGESLPEPYNADVQKGNIRYVKFG